MKPLRFHLRLREIVIEHSSATTWGMAKNEWYVESHWEEEELDKCVCGKEDIKYIFSIRNYITGFQLYPIGSSCINHFDNQDMSDVVRNLLNARKRIVKYKNYVFTHSSYADFTIHEIAQDDEFMDFVIHKRQQSHDKQKNKDYRRLIDYYNLKRQDLIYKETLSNCNDEYERCTEGQKILQACPEADV